MYRIDVTGVPGVGKSTLLDRMKKFRMKKSQWFTESEAIFKTFIKSEMAMQRKLKYMINLNPKYIKKSFVKDYLDGDFNSNVLNKYFYLVEDRLNKRFNNDNYPKSSKIKHVYFYQNKLKSVYLINEHCENIVFFDESVTHHTSTSSFEDTYKKFGSNNFLFPDMILHITAPLELVVKRLNNRNKKGRTKLLHDGKSIDELRKITEKRLNSMQNKIDNLSKMGIDCLTISFIGNERELYKKILDKINSEII